jgi:hypothetical protein
MDPPQMLTELYPYTTDINPLISLGGIVSINELTLILEEEFEESDVTPSDFLGCAYAQPEVAQYPP